MDLRKECYECDDGFKSNILTDDYNTNKYGQVICGDCGVKTHCFCDDCGEYVPNSACTVYDGVIEVSSATIDETKVVCDGCDWEINNEN